MTYETFTGAMQTLKNAKNHLRAQRGTGNQPEYPVRAQRKREAIERALGYEFNPPQEVFDAIPASAIEALVKANKGGSL